jgi:hypothetical protein
MEGAIRFDGAESPANDTIVTHHNLRLKRYV